ncbi:MAG TPA: O-antigen ligase family protein [Solirubrobacterales bacterium]|nr:O-antigen ligase family protein [Solirubrobacterales bacterium]
MVAIGLLVFGLGTRATLERPLYVTAGLIGGLSFLCAISSFWSGSAELSVIEADRVLAYLGLFLAAFLIAQTSERRQRFAEGLAISLALIGLLALGTRLLPHLLEFGDGLGNGPRLSYPLGYWNANGVAFGIAVALLLWMSRQASAAVLRWISVAVMPALLLALYFTYSRGGLLALAVATGCLLVLSRDRLWLLGTLAIGSLGALPALLAVQDRRSLADNLANQAAVDQGATVLAILLGGVALSLLLFAGLRWLEQRGGSRTGRIVELSRNQTLLRGLGIAAALLAVGAAIAVGGRAWDRFSDPDIQFPQQPEQHFSDLSSAGRHDFWRVSIDAFGEKPLLGHGAGTYEFSWEEHRSIDQPLHDAHSLYLEAFAELGLAGGILVLALVGSLLWFGLAAWRNAAGPDRDRYAVLLAVMLAFAVGAGIDWLWEIAGLGAIFFLAAGVVVAARCSQLALDPRRERPGAEGRRYGFVVAGIAIGWIAAIALIGPLLVDREIDASQSAAAENDVASAIDHAERARSIEPWAASPYVQLGLLAELQGEYETATTHFTDAIEREDHNWQLYYLRSRVEHEAGDEAAAQADLDRARELNPRADCLNEGWNCG